MSAGVDRRGSAACLVGQSQSACSLSIRCGPEASAAVPVGL